MNLQVIFEAQTKLMVKYHHVETQVMGALKYPTRVLHQAETQDTHVHEHIRSLLWKCLEELGEASREVDLEVVDYSGDMPGAFKVELIDALHFLTEACTFAAIPVEEFQLGIPFSDIFVDDPHDNYLDTDDYAILVGRISMCFSDATYCLKDKPWKQDRAFTDWGKFKGKMVDAYKEFMVMLSFFMSPEEIISIYLDKKSVNEKRMESGY